MIVVTLAALGTGAVAAWRGHRSFCLERATFHRSKIVEARNTFSFVSGLSGSDKEVTAQFVAEIERQEKENVSHAAKDSAYQHAIWRPWERFWIDDSVSPREIAEHFKSEDERRDARKRLLEIFDKP